jgi:YVTN family beta-propeller protein
MRKVKLILNLGIAFILATGLISCEEEENNTDISDQDTTSQATIAYVVNEGQFQSNNGSVSKFFPDSGKVINTYFKQQNGRDLGDIFQDMSFYKDKGFLVVNNSKKMEIVDRESFETLGVVENLSYPRQFLAIDDTKGYLTDGNSPNGQDAQVLVIDIVNYNITDTIKVGPGPESMVRIEDKVFVTNAGGFSIGNTVSVIDVNTDNVIQTVETGKFPTDIVKDVDNNVWVYCKGAYNMDTYAYDASLVKINTSDYETETFDVGSITSYGNYLLAIDSEGRNLYFEGSDGVYSMSIDDTQIPGNPEISRNSYGIDINPVNGNIICLVSTQSKGFMYRYDENHNLLDSLQVGYSPNAVVFE